MNKNGIPITNTFQKTLDEPKHKPSKLSVDKGSKFYSGSLESWL